MRLHSIGVVALAATFSLACAEGRKSGAGFRLPDGDPVRGEAVFVAQKCNACHQVDGVRLPAPVADPAVPVVLGGETIRVRTEGELVTAIVHPSHSLAFGYRNEDVASGRLSRMGDFSESMSVRDLIDVVAFLQSHYVVTNPPPPMP
jgi:mono/diheme cytochrome c family protein